MEITSGRKAMKQQAITRYLSISVLRPVILAGMSIFLLPSCHLLNRIAPEYIPPQIISDNYGFFYPPEAYEKQLEGTVILQMHVQKNGYVGKAEIFRSSGYDILDDAALAMARTVRFKPAQVHGKARDMWLTWPVVFELLSASIPALNLVEWQRKALEYQTTASTANFLKCRIAQSYLFNHYVILGKEMIENRSILPNRTIMEIVASPTRDSWIEYQDVWPMAFVLFQDYIDRFPNSKYANKAEDYMVDFILKEVSFLKKASTDDSQLAQPRKQLLSELTRFLEEHYPDALKQNPA